MGYKESAPEGLSWFGIIILLGHLFDSRNVCLTDQLLWNFTRRTGNMASAEEQYTLSKEDVEQFVQHGWIKLSNCFSKEQADDLQKTLWTRLGMDPNDRSTW
jgi:hypothetical protein